MTHTTTIGYLAFLIMAGALVLVTTAQASEVTGVLSSDPSGDTQTTLNIQGTVSGASNDGSNSSDGGSTRSDEVSNEPSGEVFGASNTVVPGFPNAGFASGEITLTLTPWSRVVSFFFSIVSLIR